VRQTQAVDSAHGPSEEPVRSQASSGTAVAFEILIAAAIYALAASLGLTMAMVAEQISVVWPATGVALAILVLRGRKLWPAIALGAFAANVVNGAAVGASIGIAIGNTLEALIGAALLARAGFEPGLRRLRDVAALFVYGGLVSTVASATIGVASLCVLGHEPWSGWPRLWIAWWIGDAIGNLVVAPFIFVWADQMRRGVRAGRLIEMSLLVTALVALSAIVFATTASRTAYPVHYLVFPAVVWAALRLGQHATASLVFFAAAIAIAATLLGRGPFVMDSAHASLVQALLFMAVLAITGLVLGASTAERHRAERARAREYQNLRRSEEQLAEADRRKDEFLAVLGHELRNPLAPLQNGLALLARGPPEAEGVARARILMERQLRHLVRLVDDLLDLSRIRTGKIVLARERVDLADVVQEAVELARPVIDARHHHLHVGLPEERIELQADATRMPQLLANLLNNAAKYTADGGEITIEGERAGGEVIVRVRDTGIGLRPEELPRVFELFAQGGTGGRSVQGGLGVGLSLARTLAELHGGTLTAHSDGIGKGSEFRLRLPVREMPQHSDASVAHARGAIAAAGSSHGARLRVLVVDDHVDAAESLAMVLVGDGHDIRTAYDGVQALSVARTFRPHAMVLDLGMPGMDGYEVARAVRADTELAQTRLVALSGYGQPEDTRRSAEAGFDRHLVKPADPDKVIAAIQND
jgi:signal transduction histidine kinase/CheY-like chemotaxis protein